MIIMNKIFNKVVLFVVASFSCIACTEVDLCQNEEHPHMGVVEISYKWNSAKVDNNMVVMPYRIVNEWSCVYISSSDGATGHYISNNPDAALTDNIFKVKAGELRFLSFSYDVENKGFSYMNALSHTAISRNSVAVEYKAYTLDNPIMKDAYGENISELVDSRFNYILNGNLFTPIYSHYTGVKDITTGVNFVEFSPKNILDNYQFNFNISAKDVTVDKVIAQLSGIPYRYNFTKESPEADSIATVLFDVNNVGASEYLGNAIITGLLRADNSKDLTGTGVLSLAIFVTDASGESKVYKVSTNLYNYIPGFDNLLYGSDREFHIDAPIVITNNGLNVSVASTTGAVWSKVL